MQPLRRKLICVTGVIALNPLSGCTTPANPTRGDSDDAARSPTPKVGQYWDYAVRDAYTGIPRGVYRHIVSAVDTNHYVVDVLRDGSRVDSYIYATGWNPSEQPLTNLQRFRYEPAFPAYEFPLHPGKAWRRVVRATDPGSGKTYSVHVQARVGDWTN